MRDEIIRVTPFKFIDYLDIKGCQCVGEHGMFRIVGHIAPDSEQEYLDLMMTETWVHVDAVTYNGNVQHLFIGIIFNGDIEKVNNTCILTLVLVTGSYLMDRKAHIRSFQDAGTLYDSVLDTITREYFNRSYMMTRGIGIRIPGFLLQYNETDWKFARRLASHFATDIYTDHTYEGIKIHFGEPDMAHPAEVNTNEYSIIKRNDDVYGYMVQLREIYKIGDWLSFNGTMLWVAEVTTEMTGNELYHTYFLVSRNGIQRNKEFNEKCTGASLTGTVTAVDRDKVQVELQKDENKNRSGKCRFVYATPYSTPDGTGWYCMPEIGDTIRLHMPSENEGDAYVTSSVHMESSDETERNNPDYKSIMNKQGKEILFTPESLVMTNNAGMSIEILDREGIRIISDKNITIQAADAVEITSANSKLELYASDNILLKQGNTQMNMDGEMRLNGARLNLN